MSHPPIPCATTVASPSPTVLEKNAAFSLTELLVVIAILLILIALAVPMAGTIMAGAKAAKCTQNLRQLAMAFQTYSSDNDGDLPYAFYGEWGPNGEQWNGIYQMRWMGELAPYLDYTWNFVPIAAKTQTLPDVFHCPSDTSWAKVAWGIESTSYGGNPQLLKAVTDIHPVGTPRTKRAAVARPSEMILLGDSINSVSGGWGGFYINRLPGLNAIMPRHNGHGNIGWLDGHVSRESATNITALRSEASPYPHWMP